MSDPNYMNYEILDDNVTIQDGRIKNKIQEEDSVVSVKREPVYENDKQLCTINNENIKPEQELHTELIIKSEIWDENLVMEGERIKIEIQEEGSNVIHSYSVVSVKREPGSDENDKQFYTISYEDIKLEQELHTELIIKSEILDETILMEGGHITNEEAGSNDSDSVVSVKHEPVSDENDKQLYIIINDEDIKLEQELHTEVIIKNETLDETDLGNKPFACEICNKGFTCRYT
ncbi:uncharacterized protein LOC123300379 [Chrysoperla carnea]|uniref:uncharacterized protein LOC123300379 n=1 Tax=Chrysoperla carnea TaxID=189513 RepID=UPI001D0773B8|nr:uncharacterized protein LOC123300379 [Chrysoperla carnea]